MISKLMLLLGFLFLIACAFEASANPSTLISKESLMKLPIFEDFLKKEESKEKSLLLTKGVDRSVASAMLKALEDSVEFDPNSSDERLGVELKFQLYSSEYSNGAVKSTFEMKPNIGHEPSFSFIWKF